MIQKSYEKSEYGNLYLVPTPIGNMEDITLRALKVLKEADYVLAEDTRVTTMLFNKYEIKNKLVSCHKFNESKIKDKILNDLKEGKTIALVTDRGTPLISDPGEVVTKYLIENNINVIALPGPSALLPALSISGLDASKFLFYGFLNSKLSIAKKELINIKNEKYTLIFYESPHRLSKTLPLMLEILGNRQIIISREISKLHEEVFRGTIEEAVKEYSEVLGEIVIIVEKNTETEEYSEDDMIKEVKKLIKEGKSNKDAVKEVSLKFNISKNLLYNMFEGERK